MTNHRKAKTGKNRPYNQVDGRAPLATAAQRKNWADMLEALGFIWLRPNAWSFTWEGDFPSFVLTPGIVGHQSGLVAYGPAGIEILFPYGCNPNLIKIRLDDEIASLSGVGETIDIDWLMADLPQTTMQPNPRPGAEYGVI